MKRCLTILLLLLFLLCGCTEANNPESAQPVAVTETIAETEPPTEPETQPPEPAELKMHVLSVGQADCILLQCNGETLLIDAGTVNTAEEVVSYLQEQGIEQLDVVISTHGHYDHVGGLAAVVNAFPVETVYSGNPDYASAFYAAFVKSVKERGIDFTIPEPGDQFLLGDALITFCGPVDTYERENDNSIVVRVVYGEKTFLLAADMEKSAEEDMLNYWGDRMNWNADILKVGHHGSNTSTGERLIGAVCPQIGIITCHPNAALPSEKPVKRLQQAGTTLYYTASMGNIVVTTDGTELEVAWSNPEALPDRPKPEATPAYYGSKEDMVVHMEGCSTMPADRKRMLSYEVALMDGYQPCTACLGPAVG